MSIFDSHILLLEKRRQHETQTCDLIWMVEQSHFLKIEIVPYMTMIR